MYLECVGNLNPEWRQNRFREILAKQMLTYNPTNRLYAGDEKLRACMQQKKSKRSLSTSAPTTLIVRFVCNTKLQDIDPRKLDEVKGRLCGFLDDLLLHEQSIVPLKNKAHQICKCCGKIVYHICEACPDKPASSLSTEEMEMVIQAMQSQAITPAEQFLMRKALRSLSNSGRGGFIVPFWSRSR